MRKIYERPRSMAARCSAVLAPISFWTAAVALLAHWFGYLETRFFLNSLLVSVAIAILAAIFSIFGVIALWRNGAVGGRASIKALLIAALVLAPVIYAGVRYYQLPKLIQVSTDLITPPELRRSGSTIGFDRAPVPEITIEKAQEQLDAYPELGGRRYQLVPEQVIQAIKVLLDQYRWEVVEQPAGDETVLPARFQTVAMFPYLALPSDLVIRVESDGESTFVDIRSASRFGAHDLGMNAWLVVQFLEELDVLVIPTDGEQ